MKNKFWNEFLGSRHFIFCFIYLVSGLILFTVTIGKKAVDKPGFDWVLPATGILLVVESLLTIWLIKREIKKSFLIQEMADSSIVEKATKDVRIAKRVNFWIARPIMLVVLVGLLLYLK